MSLRRRLVGGLVGVAVALGGAGWYYSSQALAPGGPRVQEFDLQVISVGPGTVTVPATSDTLLAAVGLAPEDGDWYVQLTGPAIAVACVQATSCVTRQYDLLRGSGPVVGDVVTADTYFFPMDDPSVAVGTGVQELAVTIGVDWPEGEGQAPAWFIAPTTTDVVVVGVHGRGADRAELLRLASLVVSQGHGMLIPSYRGDGVAADPPDGLGRFGTAEWVDVAMAMRHPDVPGDVRFVLAGYSQGGAVVSALLREADIAERVVAVILDSPLLGLDQTMQLQARLAGIPNPLIRPVLSSSYLVSRLRGFDFGRGEFVDFLANDDVPLLLFHGPDDTFVAAEPSDALAQLRSDVHYQRTVGVDHVRFWNHDPAAYTRAVHDFLQTEIP